VTHRLTAPVLRLIARLLSYSLLRVTVRGVENIPLAGGVLLTMNHPGGADPVLVMGFTPRYLAIVGKAEIMGWPVLAFLAWAYGMIPVQRGEVDRGALKAGLAVLRSGGALLLAPEGREVPSGAMEKARGGAAFLAVRGQVPILPIAITGTAWANVLSAWRRLRRPPVTLTFGQPFRLAPEAKRPEASEQIMRHIAALLPPEYRGVYAMLDADDSGRRD